MTERLVFFNDMINSLKYCNLEHLLTSIYFCVVIEETDRELDSFNFLSKKLTTPPWEFVTGSIYSKDVAAPKLHSGPFSSIILNEQKSGSAH